MSRFVPIPAIPVSDIADWEVRTLNALKVNIELLTAIINTTDPTRQALLKKTYTLPKVPLPTVVYPAETAGSGLSSDIAYSTSSLSVPLTWVAGPPGGAGTINSLGTIADLERLRVDVANTRAVIEAIIRQFEVI